MITYDHLRITIWASPWSLLLPQFRWRKVLMKISWHLNKSSERRCQSWSRISSKPHKGRFHSPRCPSDTRGWRKAACWCSYSESARLCQIQQNIACHWRVHTAILIYADTSVQIRIIRAERHSEFGRQIHSFLLSTSLSKSMRHLVVTCRSTSVELSRLESWGWINRPVKSSLTWN